MDLPSLLLDTMDADGIVDITGYKEGSKKRKRSDSTVRLSSVPQLNCIPSDSSLLQSMYSAFYVLHIQSPDLQTHMDSKSSSTLTWKGIQGLFASLDPADQETWCIETKESKKYTPQHFLQPKVIQDEGYCSFLIQKKKPWLEGLESSSLITSSSSSSSSTTLPLECLTPDWSQGECTWIFFGRNGSGSDSMDGRPEHTDAVSHDGTWHYQLSGRKTWFLRPTDELIQLLASGSPKASQTSTLDPNLVLEVHCEENDVLLINTRLWWHRTKIPPQHLPSVSYARDFHFSLGDNPIDTSHMSNVDGMYAVSDIEKGCVIFREEDIPDCELHRSRDNPNCEVVMLEDEGMYAVISIRPIKSGEFFCVAESDDEDKSFSSVDEINSLNQDDDDDYEDKYD
jgi:hypothetical protein